MPTRRCQVSFTDGRGVSHSTEVLAGSVLEAAADALRQFRGQEMLDDDGVFELCVEVVTRTVHKVPLAKLRAWLDSNSPDPKTQALKARLR